MAVWRSFVSFFIPSYTIAVFDLPGQGRSQILTGPPGVSLDEQVEVLHQVVTTVQPHNPISIAAASWGTIVAAAFAARHPTAVDKLILGSFGVKPSPAMLHVIRDGQKLFDENRNSEIAPLMIKRFGQYISNGYRKRIIEQFRAMTKEQFLSFYEHCEFVARARQITDYVDLYRIKAHTLIVNGEHDAILDLEDVELASRAIPHCEVKVAAGAGHFLHFERTDILKIYEEFLARG